MVTLKASNGPIMVRLDDAATDEGEKIEEKAEKVVLTRVNVKTR